MILMYVTGATIMLCSMMFIGAICIGKHVNNKKVENAKKLKAENLELIK